MNTVADRLSESAALAEQQFRDDTARAFADAYRGSPTCVEWVTYGPPARIKVQPTRDAFLDELEYYAAQDALWEVLANSQCPYVAKLKQVVESAYAERWAAEIAEMRAGV